MASYKDQLHKIIEQSSFPADRAEDIKHDIHSMVTDGSVVGEVIADFLSNVVGTTIDKLGADTLFEMTSEAIQNLFQEALSNALQSDEFSFTLAEQLGVNDIAREPPASANIQQEMGS